MTGMTEATEVASRFSRLHFNAPWELTLRRPERYPIIRPTGQLIYVTMSHWHWWAFSWITGVTGYPKSDVLDFLEEQIDKYTYDQALQWWLECYFESWCRHTHAVEPDDDPR